MGMVCGFKRSFAVQFSFLLSVPAVLGATVVSIYNAASAGIDPAMLPRYLCGMAASAVSGYFSIRLLRYLAAHNYFGGFAYYCWGAGLIALVLSLIA
jgi:undecaprenyl-diphosphatase